MRKRFVAIYSVLVVAIVLLAVFVPSCMRIIQSTIVVTGSSGNSSWAGNVNYTLTPEFGSSGGAINGTSVPSTHSVAPGNWTCAYVSGGPPGAFSVNITPSATQEVSEGETKTFTLNFELD